MKKRSMVSFLLFILLLFILLNHFSVEARSAKSEIGRRLLQIETLLSHRFITRVNTKEKIVALTFDDGPDPRFTPEVLNILKKYKVPATFFVVGQDCAKYPEIIKREAAEGHEIENHTYTHRDLSQANALETEEEILENEMIVESLTKHKPHYFRPPKRLFTNETVDMAEANGYQTILWTVCVEHNASKTVQDLADRVINKARPGCIILAHDGRLNRSRTVKALPIIIEGYQKKGYRFVTLDELMKSQAQ